ncbi:hypothetical protein [Fimbriiglobus ruber]|uniref:Uncharacterized protein n=1 Tax=Fimbriiglobus ruber TaxID=1908690 RepID=A0A225DKL8_9BACT|nr:hypothetical protein [Fimbriiglobus ruber]OWK40194.1 hypothetical protein FRUB_05113 [Fimbriiglobus ruber]
MPSCFGLEDPQLNRTAVSRAAPRLFGLYSLVAILYYLLPEEKRTGSVSWAG